MNLARSTRVDYSQTSLSLNLKCVFDTHFKANISKLMEDSMELERVGRNNLSSHGSGQEQLDPHALGSEMYHRNQQGVILKIH